jgi:hypothetical protein
MNCFTNRNVLSIEILQLNTTKPTEELLEKCEIHAKIALLVFYPFRFLADLTIEGSYWTNSQELQRQLEHKDTIFRYKGFDILQNIYNRMTLEKELKWAKDPVFFTTKNEKPDTKSQQDKWQKENNKTDNLQMGLHSR